MSHDHSHHNHSHTITPAQASSRAFITGIVLNTLFVFVEVVAGVSTHSLALLTDAGHNLSDVGALLLSLLAFRLAKLKPTTNFTYGFKKSTILAALLNAVLLLVAVGVIGYESFIPLRHPEPVQGAAISWVAGAGIVVNGLSAFFFFRNRQQDLNIKGAYLHMLADALVSLGVVIAGIIISYTHWFWVDSVTSMIIMIVILLSTWSLLRDSLFLSMDAVPSDISMEEIAQAIRNVDHVVKVDHIHVWAMSTTENALTAQVKLSESLAFTEMAEVISKIKHELLHLGIQHPTIEID